MAFDAKAYIDRAERGLHGETHDEWRERAQGGGNSDRRRGRRDSGRRSGPPIAKNPANQDYVNKLWEEQQAEKERKRQERAAERRAQRRGAGRVAGAIVTGAITLQGAIAEPQQNTSNTQSNWVDAAASEEGDRRRRDMDRETRSSGDRRRWSGQSR